MGTKKEIVSRRGDKTEKAVEALKSYISGISKKQREAIERELEQANDLEEDPAKFKAYYTVSWNAPSNTQTFTTAYSNARYYYIPSAQQQAYAMGNWEQKQEIEEDIQDVSFEE